MEKKSQVNPLDNNAVDVKKGNFKLALQVFGRTVLSAVLCLFVYMSLSAIIVGLNTKTIGYRYWEIGEDGSRTIVSEVYNSELESSQPESSAAPTGEASESGAGETTATETPETLPTNWRMEAISTELPEWAGWLLDILSQILMILLLAAFPYTILWSQGDRDKNSVNFKHMEEDKLRGLKVGLMAAVPSLLVYIVLVVDKLTNVIPWYLFLYRYLNIPFLPIIGRLLPDIATAAEIPWPSLLLLFLPLLFIPLLCFVAYALGYKQISLFEKFAYENTNKKKKRRR